MRYICIVVMLLLLSGCASYKVIIRPKAEDGTLVIESTGKGSCKLKLKDNPDYSEIEVDSKSEPILTKTIEKTGALILSREAGGAPVED